jgi:tetratricopeptide (TPR) repeat protein
MSNFSTSDIIDDTDDRNISCRGGASDVVEKSKSVKRPLRSEVPSTIVKQNLSYDLTSRNSNPITTAVAISGHQESSKKEDSNAEDVTEKFISRFNSHRGNSENVAKAQRLLIKTRQLAGLEPSEGDPYIDIPSARRNLFLLAGLNHQELKMAALSSLIEVLEADQIKRNTAFDLIVLAIDLMKQMDRELMQTVLVDEQICICQAYGMVAELIQRHYAKKHLGGITAELKTQLIQTAKTLEDLNTHSHPSLHFAVEYALEGIKRLRDDRKELFEIFERMFHLLTAAAAFQNNNYETFTDQFQKVYQGLDIRITHSWYDFTMLFNELAKNANKDRGQLSILQFMVKEAVNLDWKYLFNAIDKFGKIAREGSTLSVRKAAFMGQKIVNGQYPGIIDFIDFNEFELKTSLKPIIHFKAPVSRDNNIRIRHLCIEILTRIALESPHSSLRKRAKQALAQRLKQEDDPGIVELIANIVPAKSSQKTLWVNELDPYAYTSPKVKEKPVNAIQKPNLKKKSQSNQIQFIANHLLPTASIRSSSNPYVSPRLSNRDFEQNVKTKVSYSSPEDDFMLGKTLLKAKQASDALDYFNQALQKIGKSENQNTLKGKILYRIGQVSLSIGNLKSAEEAWLNSLRLRPKSYVANIALAKLYKKQCKILEASHYGEKALKIKPEDIEAKKFIFQANRRSARF